MIRTGPPEKRKSVPEIQQVLFLSTGHIQHPEFSGIDDRLCLSPDSLYPISYEDENGWWVHVPSDSDDFNKTLTEVPKSIGHCLLVARSYACNWIRFDPDVDPLNTLPVYKW
jgi:hypothetical protein